MQNKNLVNRKLIHIDLRKYKFNPTQINKILEITLTNIKSANKEIQ